VGLLGSTQKNELPESQESSRIEKKQDGEKEAAANTGDQDMKIEFD